VTTILQEGEEEKWKRYQNSKDEVVTVLALAERVKVISKYVKKKREAQEGSKNFH